jgi:hypothetical protein
VDAADWNGLDLESVAVHLRERAGTRDVEKTVWAFEQALELAREDAELLDYLLTAVVCVIAHMSDTTPREILEIYFRHAPSEARWRSELRPLLDA